MLFPLIPSVEEIKRLSPEQIHLCFEAQAGMLDDSDIKWLNLRQILAEIRAAKSAPEI